MLEVNKAVAEAELMPLFSKQIEIAQLSLDGAKSIWSPVKWQFEPRWLNWQGR